MKNLANALIKAQAEMAPLHKDGQNPHLKSKYATLAQVQDVCLPALGKNGIVVFQGVGTEWQDGSSLVRVSCTLFHAESGENIVNEVALVPAQSTPQGIGSAITYARRYLLMTMAGIAPEDDDGTASSQPAKSTKPQASAQHRQPAQQPSPEPPAEVEFMDNLPADETPAQTNGHAPKAGQITDAQKGTLHALGTVLYPDWDTKRPELVKAATKKRATSSNDLWQAEAAKLIVGMETRLRKLYEELVELLSGSFYSVDPGVFVEISQLTGVELAREYTKLVKLAEGKAPAAVEPVAD